MENKVITVFTPTYNRINLLPHCFDSLKRQTCKDFLWLIVDDGSKDGTRELVQKWMAEADFEIRYIYKENEGLHTAYNAAIDVLDTELAICVDSDDYLTDDAIAQIAVKWSRYGGSDYAGIVALNRTEEQSVLGKHFPDLPMAYLIDLYCHHGCRSDLKMIYRAQLLKDEGPIPAFYCEKHMNPYYLFLKIDKKLPMLIMNSAVCVVNYQKDGLSANIVQQYIQSPRSFAELRIMMLSMERASVWYKLKNTIHLVSSAVLAKQFSLIWNVPNKLLSVVAILPGLLLTAALKFSYTLRYKKRFF